MHPRSWIALAVALLGLLVTTRAHAWQEAHEIGDDVDVRVDADGVAAVRHRIRWHVVRGPLKSIDLANVDPAATLQPDVVVTAEDGRELGAHVARVGERDARITLDEPRAVMRGTFVLDVRWRVDLVASRALARDGGSWRLTWSSLVATEGFDAARTTFDFPAAPDEPRPILADTGAVDDGAVSTLRHEAGRDVLELVRPHVARGETMTWLVRVDPRALGAVVDPRLRPQADLRPAPEPDRVREVSLVVALGGLAIAFGLLVLHKSRVFEAACARRSASARALLPLPTRARAVLAGAVLASGVALQLFDRPTAGSVFVALALLAAVLRAPEARQAPRGPGRWLVLRPSEAFELPAKAPSAGHWLDAGTIAGKLTALGAAGAAVGLAFALRRLTSDGPWLLALDALAMAPLFVTGQSAQLPPDAARSAAPWLSRAFARLGGLGVGASPVNETSARQAGKRKLAATGLRVAPWMRVTLDGAASDELRLLVLPRAAMPGVVGIELGLAWSSTPVGWVGTPEVLVRVIEASAAATKLARSAPHARSCPGRRVDERVVRMVPRAPTQRSAVALVRSLADVLTDRRLVVPAIWTAEERRAPLQPLQPLLADRIARPAA